MFFNIIFLLVLAYSILFFSNLLARKYNLYDKPNLRKTHEKKASFLGGICLSLYLIFCLKFFEYDRIVDEIIIISILISIIGFLDDKLNLSPGLRLVSKTIIIFYLFEKGFGITNLGIYFGIEFTLGKLSILFTIGAVLALINSYNYADGVDGLASSIFLTSVISLITISYIKYENIDIFLIHILVFNFIFLAFNFGWVVKTKIFLGNSGSYMLGFLHAYTLIYFFLNSKFHPMIMAWSLAFIFFEFLSTNLIRISNNKSFLAAGKDHIHYILLEIFKNKYYVVLVLSLFNLITILLGFFVTKISENLSLLFFILYGFFYFLMRMNFSKIINIKM
tara:strand:- start:279 stop:1283 length:1005 start_codon:yes stop_codon:yes gene_type:complete